jgi:hypothetical protein
MHCGFLDDDRYFLKKEAVHSSETSVTTEETPCLCHNRPLLVQYCYLINSINPVINGSTALC